MTHDEKLENIKNEPHKHIHSFDELMDCCRIDDALNLSLIDAHSEYVNLGTNGGVKCDVTEGPCACGAWHHMNAERVAYLLALNIGKVPTLTSTIKIAEKELLEVFEKHKNKDVEDLTYSLR